MISEARANALLGFEFGLRPFTPAATYYLGLSLTAITDGAGFTEPNVSTGYARLAIPNDTVTWGVPSGHVVTNIVQLAFNSFIESLPNDQRVTHWFISESQTGGVGIYYGELLNPRPVIVDSQIWVNVGEIQIERTNQS